MGDFERNIATAAESVADNALRSGTWSRFAEYSLSPGNQGPRYIKAVPVFVRNDKFMENERWDYPPMVQYPDLFLRFARLFDRMDDEYDTDRNARTALGWAYDFGVLGLTPSKTPGAWWGDIHGGREDSVRAFSFEAWLANRTLKLYEAATTPGGADIESIERLMPTRERTIYGHRPDVLPSWALNEVAIAVHERIARHSYPDLYQTARGSYVKGWAFRNLLGALWLQMYFLLTGADQTRCGNWKCPKVITIEEPVQQTRSLQKNARGKYRTRADKRFCSKSCANRYHYLTKTKVRRQAAQEE